ncbi:MAG: ribose-phosphate pyrophosphokinase [Bacteroidetes bacterium]|nr:ribose-phosphate pyrophosphokinase [Bacteroidota bacterium]
MADNIKIFSGSASRNFAEKAAAAYDKQLGKLSLQRFSDGEFQISFEETVRGATVFLVQSTNPPTDNLFELLLMADAAKRASANEIIAVMPYFGWARQDRKDQPRVAIGAKLVADMLQIAGVNRVMTMDLHADQIQGFFNMPVDHLYASTLFIPYIQKLNLTNIAMAAPDMGGSKRANAYAKHMKCDIVICYKQRSKANVVDSITAIGEMEGKDIILIDDLVDTGGTLCKAADMMLERGAKSVRAMCTHAVLSGKAYENIEKSRISELIVTDTIPLKQESKKIKVLSVAGMFADVFRRVITHESISSHFIM